VILGLLRLMDTSLVLADRQNGFTRYHELAHSQPTKLIIDK